MRWFKCLDVNDVILEPIINLYGVEGYGYACIALNEAQKQDVWEIDEVRLGRWLGLRKPKATKLVPLFQKLLNDFCAKFPDVTNTIRPDYDRITTGLRPDYDRITVITEASNPRHCVAPIEEREEREKNTPLPPKGERQTGGVPGFEKFWAAYPKKEARKKALDSWQRLKLENQAETILAALASYVTCDQWIRDGGKFIPHATTWLNQERWKEKPFQPSIGPPLIPKIVPASERKEGVLSWD